MSWHDPNQNWTLLAGDSSQRRPACSSSTTPPGQSSAGKRNGKNTCNGLHPSRGMLPPSTEQLAMEASTPEELSEKFAVGKGLATASSYGSDFMVDVMKSLDLEYVFSVPGSSVLGLHESIVDYGGNRKPELIFAPARRIHCRHGERVLQGGVEAAGDHVRPHRRSAARGDELVQRLVRPGTAHRGASSQHHPCSRPSGGA